MNSQIFAVLLSGQLLLVLWQIYKEIKEARDKKKKEVEARADSNDDVRKMVFKLYRDSMEEKIASMYFKIDSRDADLRESLRALQDDMDCYIHCGGNGIIKEMYMHLCKYVREELGESYYILLLVDDIHNNLSDSV